MVCARSSQPSIPAPPLTNLSSSILSEFLNHFLMHYVSNNAITKAESMMSSRYVIGGNGLLQIKYNLSEKLVCTRTFYDDSAFNNKFIEDVATSSLHSSCENWGLRHHTGLTNIAFLAHLRLVLRKRVTKTAATLNIYFAQKPTIRMRLSRFNINSTESKSSVLRTHDKKIRPSHKQKPSAIC